MFLFCWLRRVFWIYTRASQKEQFLNLANIRGMNEVGLDDKIVVDKFSRIGAIGKDAPFPACSQKYIVRFFFVKELDN
jgi:hypothetical protein